MDLANELIRQKENLEAAEGVTVEGQYLADNAYGYPHVGSVEIERGETTMDLDLYDHGGGRYAVKVTERGTDYEDRWTRSTVVDTIILVSSLVHRITGSRDVDLATDHWPPCYVETIKHHPTNRGPHRKTRTILFRGSYAECVEYLRELEPEPQPDRSFDIRGEVPDLHVVEDPPDERVAEGELPF